MKTIGKTAGMGLAEVLALLAVCVWAAPTFAGMVTINVSTTLTESAANLYAADDVTVDGSGVTLTLSNSATHGTLVQYNFASLTVTNGAAVVCRSQGAMSPYTDANRGVAIGAGSVTITTNSAIHADGTGFIKGKGPGGAGENYGATHGGVGGLNTAAPYGSFTQPLSLGSGGANLSEAGGVGGGAVALAVTGTLTVAAGGRLSADGAYGTYSGGSGGSIDINAATLAGAGILRANGGGSGRGAAGGGRISLADIPSITFTGTIQANGGATTANPPRNYGRGHAGTIAFPAGYDLLLGGSGNMASLRLGSDDGSIYTFGDITIEDGGILEMDGNPQRDAGYGGAAVIHAVSANVKTGGVIRADNLGFTQFRCAPNSWQIIDNTGAAYGGAGGKGDAALPNSRTYGSVVEPVNIGSSGSGAGGGCLILSVSNAVTINGVLSASGVGYWGAGAGGTINVKAGSLGGNGTVTANGGSTDRGGGGGGRVSLRAPLSTFSGSALACGGAGGSGYGGPGAAGTVFTGLNGVKRLLVNNTNILATQPTYTLLPAYEHTPAGPELADVMLVVTNLGRVSVTTNLTVGDLYLAGSITNLFLNGWTLTVNTLYHADWGSTNQVVYGGGKIDWKMNRNTLFVVY